MVLTKFFDQNRKVFKVLLKIFDQIRYAIVVLTWCIDMLSFTNSFVVLLPLFLKMVSKKIFSVHSNFYSLYDF